MPTPSSSRVGLRTSKKSSASAWRIRSVRIVSGMWTSVWTLFCCRHASTTPDHAIDGLPLLFLDVELLRQDPVVGSVHIGALANDDRERGRALLRDVGGHSHPPGASAVAIWGLVLARRCRVLGPGDRHLTPAPLLHARLDGDL